MTSLQPIGKQKLSPSEMVTWAAWFSEALKKTKSISTKKPYGMADPPKPTITITETPTLPNRKRYSEIKEDLNAIREQLDDKSQYVFGFESTSASTEALNKLMGDLNGFASPQDYADLYITNSEIDESAVTNYVRDLDMRTGLATVSYDYDGVHYTREYFDSYPDNVMVIRLAADKDGKINFNTNLIDKTGNMNNVAEGDIITIRSSLTSNGLNVEGQLKVLPEGGEMSIDGFYISVTNADAATLIFTCGTDYKMELPDFRGEDPHEAVTQRINAAAEKGYEALKEDHMVDHSALVLPYRNWI